MTLERAKEIVKSVIIHGSAAPLSPEDQLRISEAMTVVAVDAMKRELTQDNNAIDPQQDQ